MPDRDVKTIRDIIYFQYAKTIARAAFGYADGKEAKAKAYGFIKTKFKELRDGKIQWSDILREDLKFVESDKKCIFCGSTENITKEHIIPKTLKVNQRCPTCDHIQGIHNIIWSCKSCNSKKGQLGLYTYYSKKLYKKLLYTIKKRKIPHGEYFYFTLTTNFLLNLQ
jgi:ribosomal protein L37AE/L43A